MGDEAAMRCDEKIAVLRERIKGLGLEAGCTHICYRVDDTPFLTERPGDGCVEAVLVCGGTVPPVLLILGETVYSGAQALRSKHIDVLADHAGGGLAGLYRSVLEVFGENAVTPILLHEGVELPQGICGGGEA